VIENNEIRQLGSFSKTMESKSIVVNDEFICSIDSIISVFDIKVNLLKKIHSDFKLTSLHSKNKVSILVENQIDIQLIQEKYLRYLTLRRKILN